MVDDAQLLRQYVETRSEPAFAELVRRHLGLVYHSALRQLGGDAHFAEDVTQGVFVLMARKSRSLVGHTSLAGWLHATLHFKVSELLRAERRRRAREAAALLMHDVMQRDTSADDWERLRPLIDELLLELKDGDREAVLLRFFEGRPFADIAARFGLSENSAHKRVERALEKLRERLAQRGVKSTATALAATLGAHAAAGAPPAGLATAITGAVMTSGLPVAAAWSAVSLMSTKTAATAAVAAFLIAGGLATHQVIAEKDAAATLAALENENATLAAQARARLSPAPAVTLQPASTAPNRPAQPSPLVRGLGSGGLASVEESRAFLQANPDLRDALAAYFRDTLNAQYADLIAELALTDAEREQFFATLARGIRRIVGEHQFTIADREVSGAEIARELRALLGEERYQRYRDFRSTAVLRDVTRELTQALYFTPTPLTTAQAAGLQAVVSRTIADPAIGPRYTGAVWGYVPVTAWDRIIAEAGPILSEPQVEALREMQQRSQFFHAQSAAASAYRAAQANAEQPRK